MMKLLLSSILYVQFTYYITDLNHFVDPFYFTSLFTTFQRLNHINQNNSAAPRISIRINICSFHNEVSINFMVALRRCFCQ